MSLKQVTCLALVAALASAHPVPYSTEVNYDSSLTAADEAGWNKSQLVERAELSVSEEAQNRNFLNRLFSKTLGEAQTNGEAEGKQEAVDVVMAKVEQGAARSNKRDVGAQNEQQREQTQQQEQKDNRNWFQKWTDGLFRPERQQQAAKESKENSAQDAGRDHQQQQGQHEQQGQRQQQQQQGQRSDLQQRSTEDTAVQDLALIDVATNEAQLPELQLEQRAINADDDAEDQADIQEHQMLIDNQVEPRAEQTDMQLDQQELEHQQQIEMLRDQESQELRDDGLVAVDGMNFAEHGRMAAGPLSN